MSIRSGTADYIVNKGEKIMVHARNKGMTYENEVFKYLTAELGTDKVERRNRSGYDGDDVRITLEGLIFSVEAKNQKQMKLAEWVDQAQEQAHSLHVPVVIHKRIRKGSVGDHYVTMTVNDLCWLIGQIYVTVDAT